MKRSILLSGLVLTLALALTGTPDLAIGPIPAPVPESAVEISEQTGLGITTCTCVCEGPRWSVQDIRTPGSCDDLVGDPCWSWGPGIFTSCESDGPPFPF